MNTDKHRFSLVLPRATDAHATLVRATWEFSCYLMAMMQKILALAVVMGGLVSAHHSTSAEFDMTKRITVTGTLTKVDWINPHIAIQMEGKDESGKVQMWNFQSNPPAWYKRVGINRADLAKGLGQTVTVGGVRAKDGSAFGYMLKISFADGTVLEVTTPDQK